MEKLSGEPILCKVAIYSSQCALQEDNTTEHILRIFLHPKFVKHTVTYVLSNGVFVRFVRLVLLLHHAFHILLQFSDPKSDNQVFPNLF